ncbi:hypothetical protein [Proteus mirabilis]|uniref:hypothetical protein n=1 Tax=Proteus mirabilis TaxID=584 RepID=UPI001EF8B493|nr:hypothetical protein [Proteus mirabilis]
MKSKIVAISLFFLPVLSQADVPVFTGDVKLACEAVLCEKVFKYRGGVYVWKSNAKINK